MKLEIQKYEVHEIPRAALDLLYGVMYAPFDVNRSDDWLNPHDGGLFYIAYRHSCNNDEILRETVPPSQKLDDLLSANDDESLDYVSQYYSTLLGMLRIMPKGMQSGGHLPPQQFSTCRQMRQFVIAPEFQGEGVGSALLTHVEQILLSEGTNQIGFGARHSAYGFYECQGYQRIGEQYISALTKIPHTFMGKTLSS